MRRTDICVGCSSDGGYHYGWRAAHRHMHVPFTPRWQIASKKSDPVNTRGVVGAARGFTYEARKRIVRRRRRQKASRKRNAKKTWGVSGRVGSLKLWSSSEGVGSRRFLEKIKGWGHKSAHE